jgi:sirohydrochlorin cobaltochelatase
MTDSTRGVVLVGHGGIPKGFPGELVTKLKRLEAQRRAAGNPMSDEEYELDQKIRLWPRTPEIDPYQAGLEKLATHLKPLARGTHFSIAYNEFCTPTLEEAIEKQIAEGATDITVVSTMFTPGGSHSEYEIPEEMAELQQKHPTVTLTYAWPFNLGKVAEMLSVHIEQFHQPVGDG